MKEYDNQSLNVARNTVNGIDAIVVVGPFNLIDQGLIDIAVEIIAEGKREIVLDCSNVTFLTSAGIACVIKTLKKLQLVGGTLSVYGANKDMKDYFLLVKLDRYLKLI
jgi:anti-anti-sigma factor